jgi:hypothetical protein
VLKSAVLRRDLQRSSSPIQYACAWRLNKKEKDEIDEQVHKHKVALEFAGTPPAEVMQQTGELRAQLVRSTQEKKKRLSQSKKDTPLVPGESTERVETGKRKREEERVGAESEAVAETADAADKHEPDDGDAGKHEPDDGDDERVHGGAGQHHSDGVGGPAHELDAGAPSGGGGFSQAPRRQTRPASAVPPAVKTKFQAQSHNTDYLGHINQALHAILAHPLFQDIRSRAPLPVDAKNDCGIQAGPPPSSLASHACPITCVTEVAQ